MFNFDVNGLVDQIKPAVEKISAALGTSGEKLLEIGVRGKVAEGIADGFAALILLVVVLVGVQILLRAYKLSQDDRYHQDIDAYWMAGSLMTVFGLLGFVLVAHVALMELVAPQYMLLLDIKAMLFHG